MGIAADIIRSHLLLCPFSRRVAFGSSLGPYPPEKCQLWVPSREVDSDSGWLLIQTLCRYCTSASQGRSLL